VFPAVYQLAAVELQQEAVAWGNVSETAIAPAEGTALWHLP
jgi:hypothetical protein